LEGLPNGFLSSGSHSPKVGSNEEDLESDGYGKEVNGEFD
jgi:hypothetical protein